LQPNNNVKEESHDAVEVDIGMAREHEASMTEYIDEILHGQEKNQTADDEQYWCGSVYSKIEV
jgi:hypothetical protein